MTVIVGSIIVLACVTGGYLLAHGNIMVLMQPAEVLIICGAAAGALVIGTPFHTLKNIFKSIISGLLGKSGSRKVFMDLLQVLHEFSSLARKSGILAIEKHTESPNESDILKKVGNDETLIEYLCDSLRLVVTGVSQTELAEMLDLDMEIRESESEQPGDALANTADSLPGLGIVAAVLGIIISMNSIGGDAASVGKHVAAALVGTFLGVILCYGFVGPLANVVKSDLHKRLILLKAARNGILSLSEGTHPLMVCESARRSIPEALRPTFKEMEEALSSKAQAQKADGKG